MTYCGKCFVLRLYFVRKESLKNKRVGKNKYMDYLLFQPFSSVQFHSERSCHHAAIVVDHSQNLACAK